MVTAKADLNLSCPLCNGEFQVPKDGVHAIPTNIAIRLIFTILVREKYHVVKYSKHNTEGCQFIRITCYETLCDVRIVNLPKG